MSIERLKSLVGCSSFIGRTTGADWDGVTESLGRPLPDSYSDLLNCFGHGVWGREFVLLHPLAARSQRISRDNLIEMRGWTDPEFQAKMMSGDILNWRLVPIGVLPYRLLVLMDWEAGEVTLPSHTW